MHSEKSNFSVFRMARLLGSRGRATTPGPGDHPSARAIGAERIEQKVRWFHGDSDEVSGAPPILADVRSDGETISRKTVAKTMRKLGLRGIFPKRWKTTTVTDTGDTYPPGAVTGPGTPGTLNTVWVGDINYLLTWEGLAVLGERDRRALLPCDRMGDR